MRLVAIGLDKLSHGKITPNMVTVTGLLAHLPIVYLITQGELVVAGVLLVIFGLFDSLDGELARLQKRDGPKGMFLDSVTDRMKEIFLYVGVSYELVNYVSTNCSGTLSTCLEGQGLVFAVIVLALGGSLLTTYTNAWGEVVLQRANIANKNANKLFRGGLAPFEVRMGLLALGLLTNTVGMAVLIIATLAWLTVFMRIRKVYKALGRV
jgi:CDP-diacylglycerol---glycerol-3-phosphate 3-phosphatidyltransferase